MNVPEIEINDQSSPESIENWDSFNGYVLLDELESEFNVKFTMDEVLDVKTVSDIMRHLQNYGVNFSD
jgi:acyl carrier protein